MVEQKSARNDVDGGTRDWRNPWRQALRRLKSSARDLACLQADQLSSPIPPRCRDGPHVGLCFGRAPHAGEGTPLEHPRKIARSTWMREAGVPVGPLTNVAHLGEHLELDLAVRLKKRLRALDEPSGKTRHCLEPTLGILWESLENSWMQRESTGVARR